MLQEAVMLYINKELKKCPKALQEIRYHVTLRAELPKAPPCESIIQLLFSCDVFILQSPQKCFLMFLAALGQKFNNIKTFVSYEFLLNTHLLRACLLLFPEVRVIKIRVHSVLETLQVLRENANNLEEICLPDLNTRAISSSDLSRVFFCNMSLAKVEKQFGDGQTIKLSFPKLKRLSIPFEVPYQLSLFKMLVLCYTKCDIEWIPELEDPVSVSAFDGALSPAICLYPEHALQMCDLRFQDLQFDFVEETLTGWGNLKCLRLLLGRSKINQTLAEKRLHSIFSSCPQLQKFHLLIIANSIERGLLTTLSVLQKHGGQFKDVCITDKCHELSHKDIISLVNCFPNVEKLHLRCKPTSRYYKEVKLSPLPNLVNFRYSFMMEHMSSKFKLSSLIVNDIIKECPNIEVLTLPMDDTFFRMLQKIKFTPKLRVLNCLLFSRIGEKDFLKTLCEFVRTTYLEEFSVHLGFDGEGVGADIRRLFGSDYYPLPTLHYNCLPLNISARYYTGDFCVDI